MKNKVIIAALIGALALVANVQAQSFDKKGEQTVAVNEVKQTDVTPSSDGTQIVAKDFRRASLKAKTDTAETKVATSPKAAKQTAGSSNWQFAFSPYLFMTGMTGTIGARGRVTTVDVGFSDIFKHLKIGLMGTFEARKGKFVMVNDLMWTKLGEERNTPGGLYNTAKVGVNLFVWNPAGGYRVAEGKAGSFDILGGMRLTSVESNLDFTTGTLAGFNVTERKTWAAPVIGGHGVANLSPKFFLNTLFDVGGGFGTKITGQFYGGAGFRVTPKIAILGGYRYMKTDYRSGTFIYDVGMGGMLFGARFGL